MALPNKCSISHVVQNFAPISKYYSVRLGALVLWIDETEVVGSIPGHSKVVCGLFIFFFFRLLLTLLVHSLSPNGLE